MKRILFIVVALFIAPVAVAILEGFTFHFWLNLLLFVVSLNTLSFIHALYLILTRDHAAFR